MAQRNDKELVGLLECDPRANARWGIGGRIRALQTRRFSQGWGGLEKNHRELLNMAVYGKYKNGRLVLIERPHKYGAIKIDIGGYRFDSMLEASRYMELKLLEKSGAISDLKLQPVYPIDIAGFHICNYRADFSYLDSAGALHVEDAKGASTAVFALKRKVVEACRGIKIEMIRTRPK